MLVVTAAALLLTSQPEYPTSAPEPDSPRDHQVHFATSADGLTWEETAEPVMKMASVPDIIELSGKGPAGAAGTLAIYLVDFTDAHDPGTERISRLVSADGGKTWGRPEAVAIQGRSARRAAVDPAVVQLQDGRVRLYYYEMEPPRPEPPPGLPRTIRPPQPGAPGHRIVSALSDDGLNFRSEEGVRLEVEGVTDPEVVFSGGEWYMFLSRGEETVLAFSADGLTFESDRDFVCRDGGVPGALTMDDGNIRVYLSARRGIVSTVYDPGRGTFKPDGGLRARGPCADPAVWRLASGGYVMAMKRFSGAEERREDPSRPPVRFPSPGAP